MTTETIELQRLSVLAGLDLDNPELRVRLDEITERTAARLGRPISLVSLVLDTAQVFSGSYGLRGWLADLRGTPVEWSFCATAVRTRVPYVVPDATADPLQATNPLVTVDGLESYAGVPIVVDGAVLGAHCVLGYGPSDFSAEDMAELERAAAEVAALLGSYRL